MRFTIALLLSVASPTVLGHKAPGVLARSPDHVVRDPTPNPPGSGAVRGPSAPPHPPPPPAPNGPFANANATQFHVSGTSIPEVDFDIGDSWSGLLPISSDPDETRKLFFWYFPPASGGSQDDLIFWTNGGPGCSSLEGLLQENGPFSWKFGQAKPTPNTYSWTNLSHVLWVEQPVGTGFSQGTPNITDETELSAQLVGFLQQFLSVFSELRGKNLFLTGESYAGKYVPFIADFIYSNPSLLDLSLKGIWLDSPEIGSDQLQIFVPAVDFVHKFQNVFAFNQSFMSEIDQRAASAGFTSYLANFLTYPPPPGPFPLPDDAVGTDLYTDIVTAALTLNPAFNVFRIFDMPPVLWDVLGFPGTFPQVQVSPIYFNRDDVKQAIHAPVDTQWTECSQSDVFVNGIDNSPDSSVDVLPRVIEKSNRTVIITGNADFVLLSTGTRLALQNMTWNGKQGFQTAPAPDSFVIDGVGAMGISQTERGLTFYEAAITGHMVPQFNPQAAFQSMQFLMGFRDTP